MIVQQNEILQRNQEVGYKSLSSTYENQI